MKQTAYVVESLYKFLGGGVPEYFWTQTLADARIFSIEGQAKSEARNWPNATIKTLTLELK